MAMAIDSYKYQYCIYANLWSNLRNMGIALACTGSSHNRSHSCITIIWYSQGLVVRIFARS